MVVGYHFLLAFYVYAFYGPGNGTPAHTHIESGAYGFPLMAFLSGTFAVSLFFLLSGFVLSIGFFKKKDGAVVKGLAIKRYPRLMLPALTSVLLCYVPMKLGLSHVARAAAITHSGWLALQWTAVPHLFTAIKEGTWGIFTNGASAYNNVLWTMTTEFFGSFLVFGFLLLFAGSRYRWVLYGLIGLMTFNTWLIGFIVGMVFADLYSMGIIKQKVRGIGMLAVLALGIFMGGYPIGGVKGTIYEYITLPYITQIDNMVLHLALGASLVVFAVLSTKQVTDMLNSKPISGLGRYTFSLYLTHIPVLFTVTTALFIFFQRHMGYNRSVLSAIAVSVPLLWVSTWLFEKYVDAPAIGFARYIAEVYEGKRALVIPALFIRYRENLQQLRLRFIGATEDEEVAE